MQLNIILRIDRVSCNFFVASFFAPIINYPYCNCRDEMKIVRFKDILHQMVVTFKLTKIHFAIRSAS